MLEKRKRAIMIGVIAACLVSAAAITYSNLDRDDGIPDALTWVICRNPDCEATYQISLKEYFTYLEKHGDPMNPIAPALVCKECGQESVYRAVKCEKCELTFERGTLPNTFSDRCPKCGHSQTEADRKATMELLGLDTE